MRKATGLEIMSGNTLPTIVSISVHMRFDVNYRDKIC